MHFNAKRYISIARTGVCVIGPFSRKRSQIYICALLKMHEKMLLDCIVRHYISTCMVGFRISLRVPSFNLNSIGLPQEYVIRGLRHSFDGLRHDGGFLSARRPMHACVLCICVNCCCIQINVCILCPYRIPGLPAHR